MAMDHLPPPTVASLLCANLLHLRIKWLIVSSLSGHITLILNSGKTSPSFFSWHAYSLSLSSLWCKAFCIVMSFFILSSIRWSSFLGHFKNGLEYLTRGTAQVLKRFQLYNLASSSFIIFMINDDNFQDYFEFLTVFHQKLRMNKFCYVSSLYLCFFA